LLTSKPGDIRRGAGLVRRIYLLRCTGLGIGCLPTALVMRSQHASQLLIALTVAVCAMWPHVAYQWVRHGARPLFRERFNMMCDAAWGGWLVAAIHFSPVASIVILLMFAIDNMAVGGWRLFILGALASFAGLLCGTAIFGTTVLPTVDPWISLTWLPVVVIYPLVLAKATFDVSIKLDQRYRRMRDLSERDNLTGLANRTTLVTKMQAALAWAHASRGRVSVLFIDLDGFKTINDVLGHSVGDLLLVEVAKRLARCASPEDTVARYGGDEFVIVSPSKASDARRSLPEAVLAALTEPMTMGGHEFFVGASIGVSAFPTDGTDAQTLLKTADIAMYAAKNRGRNCYEFYRSRMHAATDARLELSVRLRKAIHTGQLHLQYQPQVDMRNGDICGLEALARWHDEQYGEVEPAEFIKVAEASGLISLLGEWVMRTACEHAGIWRRMGLKPLRVSVNLSPLQLQRTNIVATVRRVLRETAMDPTLLELEVTESTLMRDAETVVRRLAEFRRSGISIAIDDFGIGYSSLGQLRTLPLDRIKVDRSFISGIGEGDTGAIARSIITLADALGLAAIAEGVETIAQQEFLLAIGCFEAQGFLYSKPLDVDAMTRLLCAGSNVGKRDAVQSI
jgi:diguanylate cyclase (GGDEF)-like protein